MGLDQRPYIGSWKLNGQSLVAHTPDALIYLNGDLSLPGCQKCSGKIDIQKFITEVSVDAGTEAGSHSATFSLSIPLHHTDSFARDAKFLLRPGLEVHIYMRGYFPVKGLYSNLAEKKSLNDLQGSPLGPVTKEKASKSDGLVKTKSGFSPQTFLGPGEKLSNLSAEQVTNLVKLAQNMETLQQYMDQVGKANIPNYAPGSARIAFGDGWAPLPTEKETGHVEDSQHYKGNALDFVVKYRTTTHKSGTVDKAVTWAATMKLRGNQMSAGGVGAYIEATPNAGTTPGSMKASDYTPTNKWFTSNHYDIRGTNSNWYWYAVPGTNKRIMEGGGPPPEFAAATAKMPKPDASVVKWDDQPLLRDGRPVEAVATEENPEATGFQSAVPAETGEFGPSMLEEYGLADNPAIADALAYPYYHVFHGVVTQVNHSYSGGVSTVSVSCNSMLHFWQYHNMSTNASLFGARPNNSKNKMSLVGNNFTGMHPYAIMYSLHHDMAGAAGGVGFALSSKSNQTAVSEGQDSLFSLNIQYWEKRFKRGTKLRMHGATGELFSTGAAAWLGRKSASQITKAMRKRYNEPSQFAKDPISSQMFALGLIGGPNVRAAIEATRFAAKSKPTEDARFEINILEMQAFVSNIGDWGQVNLFESTYESKLDIANKVCGITGFEFYQDVDGDFVFKPPMWNLDTRTSRVYRLEDIDLINISFSEKEPQVTYMTVKGSAFKNILGTGTENEWGVKGQYMDYRLIAQFGWRPGSYETNYFNDPRSMFFAAVNRMDVMNIAVNSASVTIPVRPEFRPGYPVYIPYLDCFYYCNSFAHSHSVGGQCTTALQLVGKRAKFFAPGINRLYGANQGIDAIKLGETKFPEKPLQVIGDDGKPRLSGFPNVVMALDPTEINPLFFVVGTDIENLSDTRVIKYMLKMGSTLGVLTKEEPEPGSSKVFYTINKTIMNAEGESTSVPVRFFFDESELDPKTETEGDAFNIKFGAGQYMTQMKENTTKDEASVAKSRKLQQAINGKQSQIAAILRDPDFNSEDPARQKQHDAKVAEKQKLEDQVDALEKAKGESDQQAQDEKDEREQLLRNPDKLTGVAVLLLIKNMVSAAYRLSADYGASGTDMSSTINLLDMLSDKKASFSNGQQPGQYRYYSASHPDADQQGPKSTRYDGVRRVVVDGDPLSIAEDGRTPPTVKQYTRSPTAPFPGAAPPEAALVDAKPVAGIRVLTSNPKKKQEVYATSEITELMFSVQDVTIFKTVGTTGSKATASGMGGAAEAKVRAQFTAATCGWSSVSHVTSVQVVYKKNWNLRAADVNAGIAAMKAVALSGVSKPVSLTGLSAPAFPGTVQLWRLKVPTAPAMSAYKFDGSPGTTSMGAGGDKATAAQVFDKAGAALAEAFVRHTDRMVGAATRQMKTPADRVVVTDAWAAAFQVGAAAKNTTKTHGTKVISKPETTYSPVFPVSDAQGYHVVGSYRYGRGVSIDPEGVFDQLHKKDILSLLDRHLVDKILAFFVNKEKIGVPITKTVTLKNGTQKVVPVLDKNVSDADRAKYLNEEALRQLRAANLTDKQILDYSGAINKGTQSNQLDFSLANIFSTDKIDGVQKVPVINAAYSLADLSVQQAGQVCLCKAAEAQMQIEAYGQTEFLSASTSGPPEAEGLGTGTGNAATRWVSSQAELAAAQWEQQQQAYRGQVLDRGGSHVVSTFLDTFGIDTAGKERPSLTEQAKRAAAKAEGKFDQAKSLVDTQIENLKTTNPKEDK